MRPKLELLEPELIDRVLSEAFELLLDPGVKVQSPEARELLKRAGASVEGEVAHIPEALARRQLSTVPHKFWLHDRAGNPVVHYGGDDVHFDPRSSGVQILDPDTLEHRPAQAVDLVRLKFGDWGISWGCGFRIADSQSWQRFYPARVAAQGGARDRTRRGFRVRGADPDRAARHLGVRCVSVPIESRYQGAAPGGPQFRRSHFRPMRELYRIASHVVKQVWGHGNVIHEYRHTRAQPPLIHDPGGEFDPSSLPDPSI